MVETAAHLALHVIPRLPVRQWVLSVPKRPRYHLERDPAILNAALHGFLGAIERALRQASPGASARSRLGGVVFIHRFGALLNPHLHFHCVVVDGVFDADVSGEVTFHEAGRLDTSAITAVQATARRRLLRAAHRRGLLSEDEAQNMAGWAHGGGFSVDADVRIEASDRAGLERLLRYCARPDFALERLREVDAEHLVYESVKPGPGGSVSLMLTPMELLDRLAALIPTPRRHRHRYVGVLAPNAPLRAVVTALAQPAGAQRLATPEGPPAAPDIDADEPLHRKAARLAWAMLIARIYEVFALACPLCGGEMWIIAFITEASVARVILAYPGEPTSPPRMAAARGPPPSERADARQAEFDPQAQPAPGCEFD